MFLQIKLFHLRISVHTTTNVVIMLNKLDKHQLEIFKATYFRHFLKFHSFFIQNQFIYAVLHKEVVSNKPNKLCVKINSVVLIFSLKNLQSCEFEVLCWWFKHDCVWYFIEELFIRDILVVLKIYISLRCYNALREQLKIE